jgi:hypothetical protein
MLTGLPHPRFQPKCRWRLSPLGFPLRRGAFSPTFIHSDVGTRSSSGAACAAFQQAQIAQLEILENGFQKWISYHLEIVTRNCDFGVQCSFSWVYINSKREKKTSSQFMPRKSGYILIGSSSDPYSNWWVTEPDHSNTRPKKILRQLSQKKSQKWWSIWSNSRMVPSHHYLPSGYLT